MKKQLSLKTLNILVWAIYLASLVPLLWIGFYDYPSADDFGMGNPAYQALQNHGVFAAVGAAAYMAWYDYWNWMGYFTSTFFMSFPPSIFGETAYAAGIWIILGILTFAVCYFLRALLVKILNADGHAAGIASAAVLFLMVQCMPQGMARVEAFYWYCSAANYLITFSQTLIFLGLMMSAMADEKRGKRIYDLVMASLLAFWIGGGNYLSALSCAILMVLFLLAVLIHDGAARRGRKAWAGGSTAAAECSDSQSRMLHLLLIPALLMLAGFAASCLAPGNNVRASGLESTGPLKTIFICLHYTLEYCCSEWTNWAVVCIFATLAPVFWHAVGAADRNGTQRLTFRFPILAVLFGYGMVAANICPPMLAESNIGAGRLQALFWMQYVLVMVLLEWYLLGWLRHFAEGRQTARVSEKRFAADASCKEDGAGQKQQAGEADTDPDQQPAPGRVKMRRSRPQERLSLQGTRMVVFLVIFLVFGSAMSVKAVPDYYTFTSAIQDLANGNAQAYGAENAARRALLKDASKSEVRLESYAHEPDLLFFTDIDETADGWQNQAMARYYGKTAVTRTPNKRLENAD